MFTNKVIGLSGVAGVGKDLFYQILSSRIPCVRVSLADNLKKEAIDWCVKHYNINPVNCSREEKNSIRDFLVFHGTFKRKQTQGRHWIQSLEKSMSVLDLKDKNVVITDIRYDDYENDEVSWLKNEKEGILVHISRTQDVPVGAINRVKDLKGKELEFDSGKAVVKENIPPANSEEARNNPKLIKAANFHVEWPTIKGSHSYILGEAGVYVDEFLKYLNSGG